MIGEAMQERRGSGFGIRNGSVNLIARLPHNTPSDWPQNDRRSL